MMSQLSTCPQVWKVVSQCYYDHHLLANKHMQNLAQQDYIYPIFINHHLRDKHTKTYY